MKRINKIIIKDFKAFREESFDFRGKNVLVLGNNGSGKSSLFWALYTFLQSSVKANDDEVKKYFLHYKESNTRTHQTLKNIFAQEDDEPEIRVEIKEDNGNSHSYVINQTTVGTKPENNGTDSSIQELNLASDFINYKLLHNFFQATHKQEINLWPVFERDIFPFLTDGTNNWLDIIKNKTQDVPRTPKGVVISRDKKQRYLRDLEEFNEWIENKIREIETNSNEFIKEHFYNNRDFIRLKLTYNGKFKFDNIRNNLWGENRDAYRYEQILIRLRVEVFDETADGQWRKIERVQSFLNESMLTKIAIGIRIGALRTRVTSTDFKILVLDDMLISLDMANRMDVIRILLNLENNESLYRIFGGFQKIILTHDLGFYELIKRHTSPLDWEYFRFSSNEIIESAPIVRKDKDRIEKATHFLADGEYDACGNELRKETEALLDKYLKGLNMAVNGQFEPLNNKINKALAIFKEEKQRRFERAVSHRGLDVNVLDKLDSDFENDNTLSASEIGKLSGIRRDIKRFLIQNAQDSNNAIQLLNDVKDILSRIMNPASHASFSPLYESELRKAIDGVIALKTQFERT